MLFLSFCSICPLVAYFLKKNYSLRQNTLKNMRVWERSLTSVPIGVYLDLIQVGTWLGIGSVKKLWRFTGKEWLDAAPDSDVQCPVSSQEVNLLRRSDRTLRFSVQSEDVQRPVMWRRQRLSWSDSGCVRSVSTRRIRSWFQRNWTSLELTERWVVASGLYHLSVRSVENVQNQISFPVSFSVTRGVLI